MDDLVYKLKFQSKFENVCFYFKDKVYFGIQFFWIKTWYCAYINRVKGIKGWAGNLEPNTKSHIK